MERRRGRSDPPLRRGDGGLNVRDALDRIFTVVAARIARLTGQPATFIIAVLLIVGWAVTGPMFDYSDTWQLIVNTSTTIVTFLMVFLIQNSQNRDAAAMQAKLDGTHSRGGPGARPVRRDRTQER